MVLIAVPSTVPAPPAVGGSSGSGSGHGHGHGRDKQPAGFEGAAAAAWDLKARKGWYVARGASLEGAGGFWPCRRKSPSKCLDRTAPG